MLSKTAILAAYDRGVRATAYPLQNRTFDETSGRCAIGALRYGLYRNARSLESPYPLREDVRVPGWLRALPPRVNGGLNYVSGRREFPPSNHFDSALNVLASIFNVTKSFDEARSWLEKTLEEFVAEGKLRP